MKVGQEIYDGFEGEELSPIWSHDRFIEGAVELQSEIVRKGKKGLLRLHFIKAIRLKTHTNTQRKAKEMS